MHPSNALHQLLHSLQQAEKRYLRIYATRHTRQEKTQYALLLDAILEQKDYDETALKAKWVKAGEDEKLFASVKNYLQALVLQAMRDYHRANYPHREVEDILADVQFLSSKGLSVEAEKMVRKAKEKTSKYELHALALQADALRRALTTWTNDQDPLIVLASLNDSTYESKLLLERTTELHILYYKTFAWRRNRASFRALDKSEIEAILAHPLLSPAVEFSDFLSQFHRLRTLDNLANLHGERENAWDIQQKIILLWEKFDFLKIAHSAIYMNSITNFLASCHYTNRFKEMPKAIGQLNAIKSPTKYEALEIEHNSLFYSLLHDINTAHWENASSLADQLEQFLSKHHDYLPKARAIAIRYNVAITYFFLEQPKQALNALNNILNDEQTRHREDIQQAARLMQAVVHYQLGNLDLLEYLLRSVKRYLKNRNALHAFEETLIHHLKRLIAHPHDKKEILLSLKEALEALRSDPDNANAPGLEEVKHWVNSMLEGRPIRDYVHESSGQASNDQKPGADAPATHPDPGDDAPSTPGTFLAQQP